MWCKLSLDLFISSVSCPGVFLGSNAAPVRLSLCILDMHGHTKPFPPSFPLLFRDKFVLNRILHPSNLHKQLNNQIVYMELIQEPDTVLATFQASFLDFLGHNLPKINGKGSKNNVDLLMEPTKAFPGILAPKVEVTSYLSLEHCSRSKCRNEMLRVESVPPMHLHPHLHHGHGHGHLHSRPFVWRRAEETLIGRRPVDLGPSQKFESDSDSGLCNQFESKNRSKSLNRGRRRKDEIKGLRGKSVTRHNRNRDAGAFLKRTQSAFDVRQDARNEEEGRRGRVQHRQYGEVRHQRGVRHPHGVRHLHGVHHHDELFRHGVYHRDVHGVRHHDVHGVQHHDVHSEHVYGPDAHDFDHVESEALHDEAGHHGEHGHHDEQGERGREHGRGHDADDIDHNRRDNRRSAKYSESDDERRESDASRGQRQRRRRHHARLFQEDESYDCFDESLRRFRRIRHNATPFVVTICPDPLHCPYDTFYDSNLCPYYSFQQYRCSNIL